ncbi:chromosomal replication initiator protein DnaA, partial [Leptolyngbya sp. FACHB-36]|uniref:DnaA ATPase domain-containing protein n=1 Tax=Leptolyngbya sp. FACHB-36 TaxID=2692808 RepID=UPI00167FF5EA|nr:chromosomal replication initiator protein DnaA [Leptolyngbya sp. FACHB-36]
MEMTIDNFWMQVLDRLQTQLNGPTFETWIKSATVEELSEQRLVIRSPNPFARSWLQKYYMGTINDVVSDVLGRPIEIHITAAQSDGMSSDESDSVWLPSINPVTEVSKGDRVRHSDLNAKYVFSRLVVGSNNRMAHAASLAVAESPGREFNPLFLCGGVGLGKTHLMQAIGHYRLDICASSKVVYVSTEKFTNDLINAIRHDSRQSFRERYRAVDVLLVDDIQFIEGKEYTQEEFFHTFNALHEAGKQVVLASDR